MNSTNSECGLFKQLRASCFALALAALVGCGQNKFEQEVEREKSAVQLAREAQRGGYDLITTDELKKLLDDKSPLVLLDAMPAADFAREHISGAVNFGFPKEVDKMAEWDSKETDGRTAEQYAEALGPNKTKLVVTYCGFVACGRSHHAAAWAKKLGYTNVKRHPGGIYAWKGKQHPTEAAK